MLLGDRLDSFFLTQDKRAGRWTLMNVLEIDPC